MPLNATVLRLPDAERFERYRLVYSAEASERVPGIMMRKPGSPAKQPVAIALHGTGDRKEGMASILRELAARGFLAVAIDGRYHGERPGDYSEAIYEAWNTGKGHPFLYDSVWDVMRLIDYLETRPDVDASRIGIIGYSKGGMEAYLAAGADPRIQAVVTCLGVQSFGWALEHDRWQSRVETIAPAVEQAAADRGVPVDAAFVRSFYDRVAPGIYGEFDAPAVLPRIAPRPLFVINGGTDERTPGLALAIDAAKAAYGTSGNFRYVIQPNTGHTVRPEVFRLAYDWLQNMLSGRAR